MTTAHEPRRGPGIHPSTEDLSALAEGAEPGADGVAAHLQDCAACRAEVDAISDLLTAFAELDTPALPQEVAIRIDAALVRESMARAAQPGAGTGVDNAGFINSALNGAVLNNAASKSAASGSPELDDAVSGSATPTQSPSSPGADAAGSSQRPKQPRGSRRARWRGLGWGLASLVLVAGGLSLAFDLTSSSVGGSASSASGSAARGPKAATTEIPLAQLAAPGTMAAVAPLVQLVKEILPTSDSSYGPVNGDDAGTVEGTGCAADPRFSKYKRLATANRAYQGTAATVVVYANGTNSSSVYAVAYATPCSVSNYRVLAEGVVSY